LDTKARESAVTETLGFGMLLASVGGFMDAYSYIVRGNVFATGQTGNLVLVAVGLAQGNIRGMLDPLVPILAFGIGNLAAWHLFYSRSRENMLVYQRRILVCSILSLFVAGLIPGTWSHVIANTLIAIASSLHYTAFRKFGPSENYSCIFSTGNLRSCADHLYKGILRKDKASLTKAFRYACILLSFLAGAAAGGLASGVLYEKAIWLVLVVLATALALTYVLAHGTALPGNREQREQGLIQVAHGQPTHRI